MIVLDTSGMVAALDRAEPLHAPSTAALAAEQGPLVLSPFILAELDYLLATKIGLEAELALLDEVIVGAYELAPFTDSDVARARAIVDEYRDLDIGLADASIVVLAARLGTKRILTLDERHFRALRPLDEGHFVLLPADA